MSRSPHRDDSNPFPALTPNYGDESPQAFADIDPTFFVSPRGREQNHRSSVEEVDRVKEIQAPVLEDLESFGFRPLEVVELHNYVSIDVYIVNSSEVR
jgi:hypothetical protein